MKVVILEDNEMYKMLDERYHGPSVQNQKEQNAFQAQMRSMHARLLQMLAPFGEEGDFYGVSDFAIRPDVRDRPTVLAQPANHLRQFSVTCLTEEFYQSGFFAALHEFLNTHAPQYRVLVDQDFSPQWHLMIFLTSNLARVNCTNSEEASRLVKILETL